MGYQVSLQGVQVYLDTHGYGGGGDTEAIVSKITHQRHHFMLTRHHRRYDESAFSVTLFSSGGHIPVGALHPVGRLQRMTSSVSGTSELVATAELHLFLYSAHLQ